MVIIYFYCPSTIKLNAFIWKSILVIFLVCIDRPNADAIVELGSFER